MIANKYFKTVAKFKYMTTTVSKGYRKIISRHLTKLEQPCPEQDVRT